MPSRTTQPDGTLICAAWSSGSITPVSRDCSSAEASRNGADGRGLAHPIAIMPASSRPRQKAANA